MNQSSIKTIINQSFQKGGYGLGCWCEILVRNTRLCILSNTKISSYSQSLRITNFILVFETMVKFIPHKIKFFERLRSTGFVLHVLRTVGVGVDGCEANRTQKSIFSYKVQVQYVL